MPDSFNPPDSARSTAKKGLELRRKYGRGGTPTGVARARDLSSGKGISRETLGRMAAFARHLDQPEAEPADGGPSSRAIAIRLWGGKTGVRWAQERLAALKRAKSKK